MKNIVITIGRQYGSGGREFGKHLADALGFKFYDQEIVDITSKKHNINIEVSKASDEKATNSLLYSIVTAGSFDGMFFNNYEMPANDKVFLAQADVIKELANESSCVMVGRCANYVLRDEENIKKVDLFIYADLDSRIERIKKLYELNDAQAKSKIIKTEKVRKNYYNYYSSGEWGNPSEYDLCINMSGISVDGAVEVVKKYIEGLA